VRDVTWKCPFGGKIVQAKSGRAVGQTGRQLHDPRRQRFNRIAFCFPLDGFRRGRVAKGAQDGSQVVEGGLRGLVDDLGGVPGRGGRRAEMAGVQGDDGQAVADAVVQVTGYPPAFGEDRATVSSTPPAVYQQHHREDERAPQRVYHGV
jgi:hypothetical protein